MKKVNPKYILKNYIIQEAIEKAHEGDYSGVVDLLKIAQNPFDAHYRKSKRPKRKCILYG